MKPDDDRAQSGQPRTVEQLAPKRRFRIQKLEDRIAPKKGGNVTHKHCGGSSNTLSSSNDTY